MSKKKAQAIIDARIQSAVNGFIIPMMAITKLYKVLESAIAEGKSDAELKALVSQFLDQ